MSHARSYFRAKAPSAHSSPAEPAPSAVVPHPSASIKKRLRAADPVL